MIDKFLDKKAFMTKNCYYLNTPKFIFFISSLEKKYDAATRVKTTRSGRLRVKRKVNNVPTANDLVFLNRSPNYCHANDTIGSLGK